MRSAINDLQSKILALLPGEGEAPAGIAGITAYRFVTDKVMMPVTENPYLYLVLGGTLRLHTPSGIMDYMEGQYSISQIDTPLWGKALSFSERQDFLALSLEFTVNDVITTVLDIDNSLTEKIMSEALDAPMRRMADGAVSESIFRLFTVMAQTVPSEFIRKNMLREIIYNVLCGSCGRELIRSIAAIRQADEIYEANSWIKENFRGSFSVEELAAKRNMSVSLFHQKFKSAVGMGPLQCQKRLRLTEARRLMLDEHKNVTEASLEVGYESVSQFIRDYRRMFGVPPKEDVLSLGRELKK